MIERIRAELDTYRTPEHMINAQQFHKEKLKEPMVLKAGVVRSVSARYFKEIKGLPKAEVFALCEKLLKAGFHGAGAIAFDWAFRLNKQYTPKDFTRFERWLKQYVNHWGSCDHLCTGPLGVLVRQFPELRPRVARWAHSKNRWQRRAAAVTLIPSVKKDREALKAAFATADALIEDADDMVQKGYGWLLKVAGDSFPDEVFAYVLSRKATMPRTALRYAIEKYPQEKRRQAMARD